MTYECIILKTALQFLDEQVTNEERKQLIGILEKICIDPLVDGETKFYFEAPPAVFTIYREANWWIIYHSPRQNVLQIVNIGRLSEAANIRRIT